jgi:hypothetical protein
MCLFSLEGIHGSVSRTAKSIGPSAGPVPDDDRSMKHTEIRQRKAMHAVVPPKHVENEQ